MAAGITENDSMFSTGKLPWHQDIRIGIKNRSETLLDREAALVAAGLDWEVEKVPILAKVNGHSAPIPGYAATVRASDKLVLGVVKEGYQVFQNRTMFDFASAVVETDKAVYETAGSLFGGTRVWALLRLPENIILPKGAGEIIPFILVDSSHDGTKALTARPTPIRVECGNTLNAAHGRKASIVIKHTVNADPMARIIAAQEALGFTFRFYEDFAASAAKLINKKMGVKALDEYVALVFPNRKGEDKETATRTQNRRDAVLALAKNAVNLDAVRGTAWAAYNAVAEFADHGITYRTTKGATRDDNRAASILGGSALALKERALALLS